SLALVGLAVWFGLRFADRQVKPLYDLVSAARRVGSGNFSMRVEGRTGADEIGLLNRAFNRMTAQIERQTQALVGANQQLHGRRAEHSSRNNEPVDAAPARHRTAQPPLSQADRQ